MMKKIIKNKRIIVMAGLLMGIAGTMQLLPKDLFGLEESTIRLIATIIITSSALVFMKHYQQNPLIRNTSDPLRIPKPPINPSNNPTPKTHLRNDIRNRIETNEEEIFKGF